MPIAIAIVAIIAVLGAAAYMWLETDTMTPPQTTEESRPVEEEISETRPTTSVTPTPSMPPATVSATVFADGTYTASGFYFTPARTRQTIDVTLTIEDDIIVDSHVVYDGKEGYSNPNQERFDHAYKSQVIGVSLQDVRLSRVGAASLTSTTFNETIADIIVQAKI